ncbi:Small-conductance mechanosensitive channel [Fodinibius salinus]|uniref:Small-conductance mechanosensitive channel n=1 Tax=Fodinibius salinus TaxID=860790 RepID=A0A5D3YJN9_9BACT|nr:mechanosensitive ion channel domain-containing protein [Fodinibius salinus]TYP92720.1 Small-conductance mechanosensitive channel [Fodinibius salinus]
MDFQRYILVLFLLISGLLGGISAVNAAPIQQQSPDTVTIIGPIQVDTTSNSQASEDTTASEQSDTSSTLAELEKLISYGTILAVIFLLIITYFVNKLAVIILDNLSERFTNYRLGIKRTVPVFRLFIWILAFYIIIAGIINPPISTVLTVLASVGIAVGFAAQDILKNIFGGFMIILDRPFQVGDKIEVGDHYGEVLAIGLRSSRIVTPDDSIVSIPNGELMNKAVSNANASALDCLVVAEIFLPMEVDVETVKRIAYKAAVSSRYVYLQKPVSVIALNEVHEENYVVKLRVKAYVLDIRYEFPFKSDMTELILGELKNRDLLPKGALKNH